ncbi:methylated-DNA--[protein]-cysteine S-methyltransferase [Marisediminicola senii]|uniref:methylated-DNA--[protein]-cysteine S-methyltransferase n=1 Tax=Marisediminicola senii TaxID=2711233 RepID=UPI0013EDFB90|nr:methylated-DNA--[protein]-cysteine S-methyltransferase [Marisediminicola senii]
MSSPLGRIEIVSDHHAIVSLAIEHDGMLPHDDTAGATLSEASVPGATLSEASVPVLDRAAEQLAEYFAGTRQHFDVPVALAGTAFQRAVWAELVKVPWGETTSYGELGLATGRATAGRAVGGAIGANPVPIIVGCHRVLATNRKITGYSAGAGVPTKVWLLDHEGIPHS